MTATGNTGFLSKPMQWKACMGAVSGVFHLHISGKLDNFVMYRILLSKLPSPCFGTPLHTTGYQSTHFWKHGRYNIICNPLSENPAHPQNQNIELATPHCSPQPKVPILKPSWRYGHCLQRYSTKRTRLHYLQNVLSCSWCSSTTGATLDLVLGSCD